MSLGSQALVSKEFNIKVRRGVGGLLLLSEVSAFLLSSQKKSQKCLHYLDGSR